MHEVGTGESQLRGPADLPVTQSQLQVVRERLAQHVASPADVVGLDEAIAAALALLLR